MYVISAFQYSVLVELALSELELKGISKEKIFSIPLTVQRDQQHFFDGLHSADGISLFDLGAILATATSVVTASIGFSLAWGPIVWGIIGAVGGFCVGFIIDYFYNKTKAVNFKKITNKSPQVIIMIYCNEEEHPLVEGILWRNQALGISVLTDQLKPLHQTGQMMDY